MEKWIVFVILHSIFLGVYYCSKKKAVEKNSICEVLAIFSTISFFIIATITRDAFNMEMKYLFIIIIKSIIITVAWLLELKAMKKMSVSIYSIVRLSSIIFTIILSIIFLGEKITATLLIGAIIVIIGLYLVNRISYKSNNKEASLNVIIILLISCFLSSISALIDKKILIYINSGQLQFWFLFCLTIMYWIVLYTRKKKINVKILKNNYWILVSAFALTVGDRFLFLATEIPESKISIIMIIKQLSVIETIILGRFFFREKNTVKKLLYSIFIIVGVVLTVL